MDVLKIIEDRELKRAEVARQLFPTNSRPGMALSRIINGEGLLNSDQVAKLAVMANTSIDALYSGSWTAKTSQGLISLQNGDYTAELDPETLVTRIWANNSLYAEHVISSRTVTLKEYLTKLEELINQ